MQRVSIRIMTANDFGTVTYSGRHPGCPLSCAPTGTSADHGGHFADKLTVIAPNDLPCSTAEEL